MKKFDIYILIANSVQLNERSVIEITSWIEKEVSKLKTCPYALETTDMSVISFDDEANELVPLINLVDFNLPIIDISTSAELNFKKTIDFLNNKIKSKSNGVIFWIVNDYTFRKLSVSNIKDSLSKLKEKITGSFVIRIQDLNDISLSDYNDWALSSFAGDTFQTFAGDKYQTNTENIIAV